MAVELPKVPPPRASSLASVPTTAPAKTPRRGLQSCPKGSHDARVLDAIAPQGDEIVLPKTSSSVFISTNIHYVLRNLGVQYLIVSGLLTDQCVDLTVRDACDFGYLVTLVTDACAALSRKRHAASIENNQGYCRQRTTQEVVEELAALHLVA